MTEFDGAGTVDFPDGSEITDPYTDAEDNVYETHEDYIDGTDQFEVEPETGLASDV